MQLKLSQRQQLLNLVAASGEVKNVECVMAHAPGCWGKPTLVSAARAGHLSVLQRLVAEGAVVDTYVLDAAAGGGHLKLCQHLVSTYDTCQPSSSTLEAAAGSGHLRLVQWLLQEANCPWSAEATYTAAAGGHTELLAWLLQQPQFLSDASARTWGLVVAGAAAGCDLATFRQLLEEPWQPASHNTTAAATAEVLYAPENYTWQRMVHAAAGSCTPDWQDKVELLLQHPQSHKRKERVWYLSKVAARPDAEARLRWLQGRGMSINSALNCLCQDPSASMGAVRLVLEQGDPGLGTWLTEAASSTGRVDILQALYDVNCFFDAKCIYLAAGAGHLPAVQWIWERLPAEQRRLTGEVFTAAVGSGNLSLLWWLSMQEDVLFSLAAYNAAAAAGSVEVIRWLYALGLPFPATGTPYLAAARHGSVHAIRALASLGCPWGRPGKVFARAICDRYSDVRVVVLQELLSHGCPVVWRSALGASKLRGNPRVEAWLRGQWEAHKRAAAEARGRAVGP